MSSTNPHDAYFREMFSQPARLAARRLGGRRPSCPSSSTRATDPGAPRSLQGLMPALAAVPELSAFVPNVTLCLDELRRVSDADLDARPLDLPGRIALTALKHGRDRRIGPHVAQWLRRLRVHAGRSPALQDLSPLGDDLVFAQPHLSERMMSWMSENPLRPVPGSIVDRWLHESEARGADGRGTRRPASPARAPV